MLGSHLSSGNTEVRPRFSGRDNGVGSNRSGRIPLRPQRVRGRRRVLTLVAASGEEVRPVWIGEAIVALRQLSDLRRTVDARENALACLLDLPQQCIDI